MASAAKSKSAKSKPGASQARKRVGSSAPKGRRRRILTPQIVCVVTPTNPTTKAISAFCKELISGGSNFIIQIYSAANNMGNLDTAVGLAVAASPKAILADGTTTAYKVLNNSPAPSCAVVMVGGDVPSNASSKLTGYTLKGIDSARHQLNKLLGKDGDITVLLDATNPPSLKIWNDLLSQNSPPLKTVTVSGKTVYPLNIGDPSLFQQQNISTKSFMLIPNAMFFQNADDISAMVEGSPAVKWVFYPEREYVPKTTTKIIKVFGRHIPHTFKNAADLVIGILDNTYDIDHLPDIDAGEADQDPGS